MPNWIEAASAWTLLFPSWRLNSLRKMADRTYYGKEKMTGLRTINNKLPLSELDIVNRKKLCIWTTRAFIHQRARL